MLLYGPPEQHRNAAFSGGVRFKTEAQIRRNSGSSGGEQENREVLAAALRSSMRSLLIGKKESVSC